LKSILFRSASEIAKSDLNFVSPNVAPEKSDFAHAWFLGLTEI